MATKKIKTVQIETNRDLTQDFSDSKQKIENARYRYYDYSRDKILEIVSKDIRAVEDHEIREIVQALFPDYLICSGLFDGILLFEIRNGTRVDPPKYFYRNLSAYLNNDEKSKVNRLKDEIKSMLEQNEIPYHDSWKEYFER